MTWLMPELTTQWVTCAPLTHYGILETLCLITEIWASYGFWHRGVGRSTVSRLTAHQTQEEHMNSAQPLYSDISSSFKLYSTVKGAGKTFHQKSFLF